MTGPGLLAVGQPVRRNSNKSIQTIRRLIQATLGPHIRARRAKVGAGIRRRAVAARGALVELDLSEPIQVRLDLPPDLTIGSAEVPLHCVAKQMGENEDRLLRAQVVVDPDLGAIQIAGERVRNVSDDDWQLVGLFEISLDDR